MTADGLSRQQQRGYRRAAKARLVYVNDFDVGYARRRCGKGFTYLSTRGKTIRSKRTRKRIDMLAIPPAWRDVWICPRSNGHIQAMGRDEDGRRQYIYHERWNAISAAAKFDRLAVMVEALPRIRRRVRKDLRGDTLGKHRVLAAVVRLIDKVGVRVGNAVYTEKHGSRGVTTLTPQHVEVDGIAISLDFPGKSGQRREIDLSDQKVAPVIARCEEIGGQFLFCYRRDDGEFEPIDSSDINAYLDDIGNEVLTAKDFRTWSGSVAALAYLAETPLPGSAKQRKRRVSDAVKATAKLLGNTKAVCRGSYIHPSILAAAETGELDKLLEPFRRLRSRHRIAELTIDECRFAALLPSL
ncbi:MAG: DNA topoisomerase IB [Gammaproteobacteria bacterium]|nr:DNA topoisomerase IB [Gammaproteobacteria bacterium]